jgi:hypothetical protein
MNPTKIAKILMFDSLKISAAGRLIFCSKARKSMRRNHRRAPHRTAENRISVVEECIKAGDGKAGCAEVKQRTRCNANLSYRAAGLHCHPPGEKR